MASIYPRLSGRARSKRDKAAYVINDAKWKAAQAFCAARNLTFRVMTEYDLYRKGRA
jgi:hypothetical protein